MLTEMEHIRLQKAKFLGPPLWRVVVTFGRSGILIGTYSHLRSARRAVKTAIKNWKVGKWLIESTNNDGLGPYWIPWENKDGRIEWPTYP